MKANINIINFNIDEEKYTQMSEVEVSVCCPIHNEEKNIQMFLESLLSNFGDLDVNWELLLLLSGCTDSTIDIIKPNIWNDCRINIIIENSRTGKANAVSLLHKYAKGKILVFTDGDTIWDNGSLKKLLEPFRQCSETYLVVGRTLPNIKGYGILDKVNILSFYYWHCLRKSQSDNRKMWSLVGQIYAIRKNIFDSFPFSCINEDALTGYLLWKSGVPILYNPNATVLVDYPRTLKKYYIQKVRTRIGWIQLIKSFKNDINITMVELRKLIIKDLIHPSKPNKHILIILLFLDISSFIMAWIIYSFSSIENYIVWKRI